jgi:tetratricopeptide (TPR) repeat protein
MNPRIRPQALEEDELFELEKQLGVGGFAHTYLAKVLDESLIEDYGTDRVALKIPLSNRNQRILNKEVENNIFLQMRLKALASHHLCRYLGFTMFRGQIVMVMEYVPDGSLRKIVRGFSAGRRTRLPWEAAVKITRGVLAGLSMIHAEHFFHRDIKPENILLDGEIPKIADLGISKLLGTNQMTSSGSCTFFYASPELLQKQGSSFPADVWATGVMLYEMVTGRLPFGEDDIPPGALIDIIQNHALVSAHDVCPEVPRWLSEVLDRALDKNPDQRSTAQQMLAALERGEAKTSPVVSRVAEIQEALAAGREDRRTEELIRQLIRDFPEEPQGYQCLGEYYSQCQLHGEAAEAFQRALAIDETQPVLHWDLALAYYRMGQRHKAIDHLERAKALGLAPAKCAAADRLLRSLRASRSVDLPAQPLAQPRIDDCDKDLARVHEVLNSPNGEESVEALIQDLVRKYPKHAQVYQCLGEYYSRCQLNREAIEAFRRGIALDPGQAVLHWDLALAYQRLGQKTEAITHFRRALALNLDPGLRRHALTWLRALGFKGDIA